MAWDFTGLLYRGNYQILTEALLPFVLIFTIIFAVLEKTKILGEKKKNFNIVISLAMALGVIIPHLTNSYPDPSWDVVNIINSALPNVSLVAVIVIMVLIVLGLIGKPADFSKHKMLGGGYVIVGILIVVFIFLSAADVFDRGILPHWLYFVYDPNFQALAVALIVFGLIVKFITADEDDKKSKGDKESLINVYGDGKK